MVYISIYVKNTLVHLQFVIGFRKRPGVSLGKAPQKTDLG